MVTHGDVDQVTNSGTTALLRRRLPTRACQFRMALPLCGDQETFQANGPTYVDSSSHRIQTMSGRYAVTARSKSIAMFSAFDPMFSAFDPLTRAATTSFGSTFHTPTLAWLTNTVLATLSAASKTGGRARQEAIHTTTCDHSLCAGKRVIHMTTRNPTRPSVQENGSIHRMLEDKYTSRCSSSEYSYIRRCGRGNSSKLNSKASSKP